MIECDDKKMVYVGEVSSDWECDKTYGHIYTFLVDLRHVVKTWNRVMHDEDKKKLLKLINDNVSI